jgi:predicted membrane protein
MRSTRSAALAGPGGGRGGNVGRQSVLRSSLLFSLLLFLLLGQITRNTYRLLTVRAELLLPFPLALTLLLQLLFLVLFIVFGEVVAICITYCCVSTGWSGLCQLGSRSESTVAFEKGG